MRRSATSRQVAAQRNNSLPAVALALTLVKAQGGWSAGTCPYHTAAGTTVLGVERMMNFCNDAEYDEFLRQTPEFERQLVRSAVFLFKFWFSVSREEQRRRFKERKLHPLKQWKLSPIDLASLDKWDDHTRAKESMFLHTDTSDAPWTVIKSNCKKRARLNALRP